jgi:DNA-binding transcriptional ArsR family regulator
MTVAEKKRKRLQSTLAAAVANPTRTRCLAMMAERVTSPAEIARKLGIGVSNIGYHVTALAEANLIEEVGSRQVRGATEHFYRAILLPIITDEQEEELGPVERRTFAETIIAHWCASASDALETGTLIARTDHHLTRTSLYVDEEGWKELTAAYMELYNQVFEIQTSAAERMGQSDEESIRVVSFQAMIELPKH